VRSTRLKTKFLLHGVEILSAPLLWMNLGCLHRTGRSYERPVRAHELVGEGWCPGGCLCPRKRLDTQGFSALDRVFLNAARRRSDQRFLH
jgi:hypothetical protein